MFWNTCIGYQQKLSDHLTFRYTCLSIELNSYRKISEVELTKLKCYSLFYIQNNNRDRYVLHL